MLGDRISQALSIVGLTEDRVSKWLGAPCHCRERREKLNAVDIWARRVVGGKLDRAAEYLAALLWEDD